MGSASGSAALPTTTALPANDPRFQCQVTVDAFNQLLDTSMAALEDAGSPFDSSAPLDPPDGFEAQIAVLADDLMEYCERPDLIDFARNSATPIELVACAEIFTAGCARTMIVMELSLRQAGFSTE